MKTKRDVLDSGGYAINPNDLKRVGKAVASSLANWNNDNVTNNSCGSGTITYTVNNGNNRATATYLNAAEAIGKS